MQTHEPTLLAGLDSDDPVEQIQAVQRIGRERRADLLPKLYPRRASEDVGYFVEEILPSFGGIVRRPLLALLRDKHFPLRGRQRAAGVLAALGEEEAVPTLMEAIGQWNVNQAYFSRLVDLAPTALRQRLRELIIGDGLEMLLVTDPHRSDYYSKLILALHDVDGQREITQLLESLRDNAKDWRVRAAAEAALAP